MKTLIIIWGLVAIIGTSVGLYVFSIINDNTQPVAAIKITGGPALKVSNTPSGFYNYNPQQTIDGERLQGGY